MGNCFATQVETLSPSPSKPPSPEKRTETPRNNSNSRNSTQAERSSSLGEDEKDPSFSAGKNKETNTSNDEKPQVPNLKIFSLADLKTATRNFRPDTVLGEGGFGRVFKGWIDENTYAPSKVGVGIPVAVKKCNHDSSQGLQQWQAEVKFLGKFSHPNLIKLLGYCWEDKEFLLVYEYARKGSLDKHLFKRGVDPPPWETRLKIAIGAARGLALLHTSEKSVIYRDFKPSNILLDGDFNAKLSDFGLAKCGPANGESHVSTGVIGTYGYTAPEYIATGHLYINSDVYGFGVVLLELLSGLEAFDTTRPSGSHNLVEWAKPSLDSKKKLKKLMDPRLGEHYSLKGAFQTAQLTLQCLDTDHRKRPSMQHVLATLEHVITIEDKPRDAKTKTTRPNNYESPGRRRNHQRHSHGSGIRGGTSAWGNNQSALVIV